MALASALRCATVLLRPKIRLLGTRRNELVMSMISYLMRNMSRLQVKLMWVGESREKGSRGEL